MFGEPAMWWNGKRIDPSKVKIEIKVDTRPFRQSGDELEVLMGSMTPEEAAARALGRTLEEIDDLRTVDDG